MDSDKTFTATTVIIGQRVKVGCEHDYETWQAELNEAAALYPGFLGAESTPPHGVQTDWLVVYRFDSLAHVQNWLNSATRQSFLDRGAPFVDGPATQQVVTGGRQPNDALVTVVVTHRIDPAETDAFLAWQQKINAIESTFTGFRGSELFRPIEGVQDDWTALYRFDSAENLDKWLTSHERRRLLDEGQQFQDFELRSIDNSFGNWFAFDNEGDPTAPPSDIKTSIAVWVGLYPTVVLLTLGMAKLAPNLKLWQGLLIGNLLSSFAMSYFTMPRYVIPLLRWWLRPSAGAPQPKTNLLGIALVLAVNAFWMVVFFLATDSIWTLP